MNPSELFGFMILTPLKEAYNHAIDDGVVKANPVANLGRYVKSQDAADFHIDPLTTTEVQILLEATKAKYPFLYLLLLCAVRTDMRQGELIGLQWGDLDLHGGFIEVRRAVVRRRITTTKTHKIRRIDMSPQLAAELHRLKETRILEAGLKGQPMVEWVFTGVAGDRVNDDMLRKAFRACLDAAQLRHIRFHDLRHTFASLLIQRGANPKYIQQQLGHASISITLDVYFHLFAGDHRHQVDSLDDPQDIGEKKETSKPKSATQAQPAPATCAEPIAELAEIT